MTRVLVRYDAACRALADAVAVDEVMVIRGRAEQLAACARIANNHKAEADAVALRARATRRLGQLMRAQKDSVGFNRGAAGGGKKNGPRGSVVNPRDLRPTLTSQGIGKRLADQARVLSTLSEQDFEAHVADTHDKVARAVRNAVREVEIQQQREIYTARAEQGGTVADLEALAASGFRAGVICPDFPWQFETYSRRGKQRSPERHYDCWSLERILAMAPLIKRLAADDCALMLWSICPELPGAFEVIKACGFESKPTVGFCWVKTTPDAECITLNGKGLHWGMGYATRSNVEFVLLAKRGSPRRLSADVHQVVIAPVAEHSAKPEAIYHRVERLYGGPYLELFARRPRERWTVWGNEVVPT